MTKEEFFNVVGKNDVDSITKMLEENPKLLLERNGIFSLTPLHEATRKNNAEATRLLLAAGADVNATDSWKHTPMHWAVALGYGDMVDVLLTANPNLNAKNNKGKAPGEIAAAEHGEDSRIAQSLRPGMCTKPAGIVSYMKLHEERATQAASAISAR